MSRRVALLALFGALVIGTVSSCASSSGSSRPADRAADVHAETAGMVMTRGTAATSSRDATYNVVGARDDTTIEALQASGTTWNGSAILRITVTRSAGTLAEQRATRCYRYTFRHLLGDSDPHRLTCPTGPPLVLTSPATAPGVSTDTAAKVRRTLTALGTADRHDAPRVQRAVETALGSGYAVVVASVGAVVEVHVTAGDQCVTATVAATGAVTMTPPADGTDCRGG